MSAILWAIVRPALGEIFRALLNAFVGYVKDRQALDEARASGRAEANADATRTTLNASETMAKIGEPSDNEVIAILDKGEA